MANRIKRWTVVDSIVGCARLTLPINTHIGNYTLPTFTLLLSIGVFISGARLLYPYRHQRQHLIPIINVLLAGMLGAVLLARIFHILINAPYFVDHWEEAIRLNAGGLDWHGAVLGGVIAIYIGAQWYKPRLEIPTRALLDALAVCIGVLALLTWSGCLAANCAYGKEVASAIGHPPLSIVETSDEFGALVPRYNTYGLGWGLALLLIIISVIAQWRGAWNAWFVYRRFWLVIALLSVGMFGIGFLRGDYAVILLGLRADQWLDVGMLMISLQRLAFSR
jgi:prolipoprotein diacylglyceryltransferase